MVCVPPANRVVLGAARRVGEHVIGGLQQTKHIRIASAGIVRVKPASQKAKDTMDRFSICVRADLQKLVIIDHLR